MVVKSPESKIVKEPTFYLGIHPIPKTNCYTYLGIPFSNDLSLKPIIASTTNKVRKALYSIKGFLKNPYIPIKFKEKVFKSLVISQVSYTAPLLGSNKQNSNPMQKFINLGLYWISGFSKGNSFVSLYNISKDLKIPPLSAKCALAQTKCFNKWKKSKCIIAQLTNSKAGTKKHTWTMESQRLISRINNLNLRSINDIKNFYWERDIKKKSVKATVYEEILLEKSAEFSKLEIEYPDLAHGFNWLLKIRNGYRFDSTIAKKADIVNDNCPDFCPCCKNGSQSFEHWLLECPLFTYHRIKYFDNFDTIYKNKINPSLDVSFRNNNYNLNNNIGNSLENISITDSNSSFTSVNNTNTVSTSSNSNSNSETSDIINNDNGNIITHDTRNYNSNNSSIDNSNSLDDNNDSSIDNSHSIDNNSNIVNDVTRGSSSHSENIISKWREVYYFLLGG